VRCPTGSGADRCSLSHGGVYAVVYAGFAVASGPLALIGLFALYGVYFAAGDGVIKAWIAGLVPPDRRGAAYGLYAAASGLLVLPASVLAGALWDRVGTPICPRHAALAAPAAHPLRHGRQLGLQGGPRDGPVLPNVSLAATWDDLQIGNRPMVWS